ncbi:MAG: threonine synthase [Clostridium sp.]|nr:threonine synthase [Clostridium sp.]MCM1400032.1 threonine synthase [Clostridium sp.]MCM1459804.1 threonine synthase [Bacteroides sp.]
MELTYKSTRNSRETVTSSLAILKGLANGGGLFVPDAIPAFDKSLDELAGMDYRQVAYHVMKLMLTDFTEEELMYCINSAYDDKFDTKEIAVLQKKAGAHFLELFHGSTIAFKDMALSILPYLLTTAAKKNNVNNEIVILTATSGDTGKAALAGFADVPGTKIIVFYPKNGVSPIQEKQMVTQKGDNTFVVGITGNFDDAQTGVKQMFSDVELNEYLASKGYQFSSANSINIGRLVPQMVYYVYAYTRLIASGEIKSGDKINVVVPTGNFGNILAAYYAKEMGLPIHKFICASNENKVLYDFFSTGCYNKNREFILTSSPSMDILISSNLERLIYKIAGNDAVKNSELMAALSGKGEYSITEDMKEKLTDFYGNYATEKETSDKIKAVYESDHYIMDTHTAVAAAVYEKYRTETEDTTPTVIASTASPYKFTRSVMNSINSEYDKQSDFELVDELCRLSGVKIPQAIEDIRTAPVRHNTVCDKENMLDEVKKFLFAK